MTEHVDKRERNMAFTENALGQIKAPCQEATPRSYKIWHAHATGYKSSFNEKINNAVKQNGPLYISDLEQLYETYLAPVRPLEKIGIVDSQLISEIEQVMAMIDLATSSTTSYTESLVNMSEKLGNFKDRDAIRFIIESLVHSAKEMELASKPLSAKSPSCSKTLRLARTESPTHPLT